MQMNHVIIITATLTLVYSVFTLLEFLMGFKTIKNLSAQATAAPDQLPSVSIIFSALNEEDDIEAAVLSLLALTTRLRSVLNFAHGKIRLGVFD